MANTLWVPLLNGITLDLDIRHAILVAGRSSFGPVCDQDSVMEFGLDQLRTGFRPGSNYLNMWR